MLDLFGRNVNYIRISVTDRCNLRCTYCMPKVGVRLLDKKEILSFEQITQVAKAAIALGIDKIRLTGGEPLVRKNFVQLVSMLGQLSGLKILAMTTNGTLLAPWAKELANRGLQSVNISLDTLDAQEYTQITRGGHLADALAGIEAAVVARLKVKLNVVIGSTKSMSHTQVQNQQAGVDKIYQYAASIGAQVQRILRYNLAEPKKDVGECERPPPCATCNKIRLLSDGRLLSCIRGVPSEKVNFTNIQHSLMRAITGKPLSGYMQTNLTPGQIGG